MQTSEQGAEAEAGSNDLFTTTHWSVVLAASQAGSPQAAQALEELCRTCWYPLYAYVRHRGHGPEDAQDLTQEFFARILERNDFAHADRTKGRFRSYLLAAMNHFLANEWRKTQAAKRGGGLFFISLDDPGVEERFRREPVSEMTPEKIYEQRWAWILFDRALARLQKEWGAADKDGQFERLKQFLSSEGSESEYGAVAAASHTTVGAVAVAVHRLRHRYRELVREEIAQTVASPAELEEELRHLLVVLG